MKISAWLSFTACGFGLLLSGCDVGNVPARPLGPAVSPLAGNWLIIGPMPTYSVTFPGTNVFSLAMSFDVSDNNITASGYGSGFCASTSSPPIYNEAFSFGSLMTGVIATDESFSLQSPQIISAYSLSLQGNIPEMNAEQFAGTHAATFNSIGSACVGNSGGTFTATSFRIVSGFTPEWENSSRSRMEF